MEEETAWGELLSETPEWGLPRDAPCPKDRRAKLFSTTRSYFQSGAITTALVTEIYTLLERTDLTIDQADRVEIALRQYVSRRADAGSRR